MTRREPTIHNRALTVTCPRCHCVPGARCMGTQGRWLKDGKAHRDRVELYEDRQARAAGVTVDADLDSGPAFDTREEAEAWAATRAKRETGR